MDSLAPTPRGLLRRFIAEVAAERGLDPELIEGRCKLPHIAHARAEVASRMFVRCGLTRQRIAQIMHLSPATVGAYVAVAAMRMAAPSPVSRPRRRRVRKAVS